MSKGLSIMRYNNPDMVFGLVDLCNDVDRFFKEAIEMVEVGCYSGESTQIFYENMAAWRINCVDKWSKTDKYDDEDIKYAERLFRTLNANKIADTSIIIHKTHSRDPKLIKIGKVDMVYIDASHHYEDVAADIDFWMPMMKEKSVIAGHDYSAKFPGVIKAVNERFGEPDKVYKDTSWAKFIG